MTNKDIGCNKISKAYLMMKKYWVYIPIIALIVTFFLFADFYKEHYESIMILITIIYVIATIQISNANIESAKATREQLAESIEQHNDTKHLQIMPFLQASFQKKRDFDYSIELICNQENEEKEKDNIIISIENIGKGSANNITYTWEYEGICTTGELGMVGIREGVLYDIKIIFGGVIRANCSGNLILHYSDILGKRYNQKIHIYFYADEAEDIQVRILTNVPAADI